MEVELWLEIKRKRIRSNSKLKQKQTRQQKIRMKHKMVVLVKMMLIQQQLLFNQNLKQLHQHKQQPNKLKKRRKKNLKIGKMPSMMLQIVLQRRLRGRMCPWPLVRMRSILQKKRKLRKKKLNRMSIKGRKKVVLNNKKQL